jgi:hypothetical protein
VTEAILEHGGEAGPSRDAFALGTIGDQQALVAFLENLVLFKLEEEEVVVAPPPTVQLNSNLRRRMHRRQ